MAAPRMQPRLGERTLLKATQGKKPCSDGMPRGSCNHFTAFSVLRCLCAWWRGASPDVLNDLPTAVRLAFEDDYVAAFGGDFSAGGDGGESFLEFAAVVGEIARCFEIQAVECEVAVKCGHDGLEEGAKGRRARDAFAGGLEERGVRGVELQNGFELFGAKVLDPG